MNEGLSRSRGLLRAVDTDIADRYVAHAVEA
jgi:hypothetical protein